MSRRLLRALWWTGVLALLGLGVAAWSLRAERVFLVGLGSMIC